MLFPSLFKWIYLSSAMSAVLVCIIFLIKLLLKNKLGAKWHCYIWFLLIIRMILPIAPESSFSVFNAFSFSGREVSIKSSAPIEDINISKAPSIRYEVIEHAALNENSSKEITDVTYKAERDMVNILSIIEVIWFLGALILSLITIIKNMQFYLNIKNRKPLQDARTRKLVDDCTASMGIRRELPVYEIGEIRSPLLYGVIKPCILLPEGIYEKIGTQGLKHIIMHEIAHIKRRDILQSLIASVLQIIHWFNPFIWFGFYRMRQDTEIACDAMVLSYMGDEEKNSYGKTIINLLESYKSPVSIPGTAGILEAKSQIERRIRMIKLFSKGTYKLSFAAVLIIAVVALAVLTNAKPAQGSYDDKNKPEINAAYNNDIGKAIDEKLETIANNPAKLLSSNPYDYINDKKELYDNIVKLGQPALDYMLLKFEMGEGSSLKGWIMADICCSILGDKNNIKAWSSGTEWYQKYTGTYKAAKDQGVMPESSEDKLLSVNHIALDGSDYKLALKMVDGRYFEEKNPGPFTGWLWEGRFILEVSDAKNNLISSYDLNSAFDNESMVFTKKFDILFEDYNGDGDLDFTIGQYASSNGFVHRLFTLSKNGVAAKLPLAAGEIFSINKDYSTKFERTAKDSFKARSYDNSKTKHIETLYAFRNGAFAAVSSAEVQ